MEDKGKEEEESCGVRCGEGMPEVVEGAESRENGGVREGWRGSGLMGWDG